MLKENSGNTKKKKKRKRWGWVNDESLSLTSEHNHVFGRISFS